MARPLADDSALRRALEESLGRENVFADERTRHSYATDASPCVVEPRAVVAVRSEEEVLRTLAICRNQRVPLTPRASGTSLSGAAVGPGVILDTTGFRRILEFSAAGGWVRVEPGILLPDRRHDRSQCIGLPDGEVRPDEGPRPRVARRARRRNSARRSGCRDWESGVEGPARPGPGARDRPRDD